MKWGVGRVIYEAAKQQEESSFVNGVNHDSSFLSFEYGEGTSRG